MDEINENQNWRRELLDRIGGLIESHCASASTAHLWRRTHSLPLLRVVLSYEVQERPEMRKLLERVIETEGKLVTASRIIEGSSSE